jgi:acetyl-CoA carboxylase alpha subunit
MSYPQVNLESFKVLSLPYLAQKIKPKSLSTGYARSNRPNCRQFLRQIARQAPQDKAGHPIAAAGVTHKHEVVQVWLAQHRRFDLNCQRLRREIGMPIPTTLRRARIVMKCNDGPRLPIILGIIPVASKPPASGMKPMDEDLKPLQAGSGIPHQSAMDCG